MKKTIVLLVVFTLLGAAKLFSQSMIIHNNINCGIIVTLYAHDGNWNTCAIDYQSTPLISGGGGVYKIINVQDWNYPGMGGVYWAPGYDIFSYLGGVWDYAEVQIQGGALLTVGNPACGPLVSSASGLDCISVTANADWLVSSGNVIINVHY